MLVRRFQPEEWVEIARGQRRKPRRHSAIAELEIILELPINSLLHSNPPKQGRRPTTGTSQSSSQANRRGAGPQARLSFTQDCRKHTIRRSEEHTSELQSLAYLVCRLLLEKKKKRSNSDD